MSDDIGFDLKAEAHEEPADRLTRLCDAMTRTMDEHPEFEEGDKAIIFIQGSGRGGIVLHNYDDTDDAMTNIFVHLTAVFESHGKQLKIVNIGEG